MKRYFQKTVHTGHPKDMWNFLKNHFQYDTMDSWNGLASVANNVKVYNLPFKYDCFEVLQALNIDNYDTINRTITEWEEPWEEYQVGFNGRNGGYLVLYNRNGNENILPSYILGYDTYEDFKADCVVKNYKEDLRFYTKLVQSFDKLCDDLIGVAESVYEEHWGEIN